MKKRDIVIFFSIFFTLYGAINYYIFIRGYEALEAVSGLRLTFSTVFVVVALSYIIGKFVERRRISLLTDILIWIGSFWFAFILYYFLTIVSLDLLRLLNAIFGIATFTAYPTVKLWIFFVANIFIIALVAYGYWNAKRIKIKTLNLQIDKLNSVAKELNVVMASDIHLGTLIGRKPTKKIVDAINALNPDIILLPGDILDSEVEPAIKQDIGKVLKELKAKYGVFGVTGNHEYIGGVEPAVKYIRAHSIDLLRDEVREIAGVTIIGREDRSAGKNRKPLAEIMTRVDRSKPLIVMDHQPIKLGEAVSEGVDLQVSGHTHRGQLWPLNYITRKVYELDWGYKLKDRTHFYVSCGVGTWGPPVKIGNDAEIVQFLLKFV
ncbi:MAG TPA: metallophosphoesterase [Candidatus Kapabacteria bacterium]|nr:metallophosphoesterase [Candidatus Kapabacteria bacterium]